MPHKTSDGTYRFVFYASDWEEPPHVHVQRENRVGKFWLDPVRLERSAGIRTLRDSSDREDPRTVSGIPAGVVARVFHP